MGIILDDGMMQQKLLMVITFSVVIMHFVLPLLPYVSPYVVKHTLIESDDINR